MIAALAEAGGIVPRRPFASDQIQPASLDLRLGAVAYRDSRVIASDCDRLKKLAAPHAGKFAETFMTSASPGCLSTYVPNR